MFKLPFSWLPGSWGLKGKPFEIAKANYELTGDDLELKLAEIEYGKESSEYSLRRLEIEHKNGELDEYEFATKSAVIQYPDKDLYLLKQLEIDLNHQKIDKIAFERGKAEIELKGDELFVRNLEIDLEAKIITRNEFEKKIATHNNEPYICVINSDFDPARGANGLYFEFDWNDQFITMLMENGYVGHTDELVLEQWFNDICRSAVDEDELMEELARAGNGDQPNSHIEVHRHENGQLEYH